VKSLIKSLLWSLTRPFVQKATALFTVQVISPDAPTSRFDLAEEKHGVDDPHGLLSASHAPESAVNAPAPRFINFDASLVEVTLAEMKVSRHLPRVETLRDVVYVPEHHCLYTTSGQRIEHSHNRFSAPLQIQVPSKLQEVKQKFIYISALNDHYGHFLIESIRRLWYAIEEETLPLLSHELKRFSLQKTFLDEFLESISLSRRRCYSFDQPVLLREVITPHPSFRVSPESAIYEVHKLLPEAVARRMLPTLPQATDQPLYFSRRALKASKRTIVGEDRLEREMRMAGFAIANPENLSLAEQVHLVNKHKVLVGMIGSALHTTLFDISEHRNLVCFSYKTHPHSNFLLVDAIKSVQSTYVAALDSIEGSKKDYSHTDRSVELEVAIEALRQMSLL